ncbi:MAG TPA: radical SAM protein [Candidatus Hydrogenedentes bacterium]|nr:radical SAM protein [Candidatus Hydrogenedentota bacterium]
MTRSRRRIAVIMLLPGCNMSCRFCVTGTAVSSMTESQARGLLVRLQAKGFENVVLGGGEPFLWGPGVLALSEAAKATGFFVQVGTNGVALPRDFARVACIDRYVLPLESMDPRIHDGMRPFARGRQGSHHALILERLETLRAAGKSVTVSTLVTAENIDDLPPIARHIEAYRRAGAAVHAWHLYKFIPEGRGGSRSADRFAITDAAYHDAADAVKRDFPALRIYKRPDMYHSRDVDFFWHEGDALRIGSQVWGRQAVG